MKNETRKLTLFLFYSLCLCASAVNFSSCRNAQKTDMRSLAPSDALIYLETNDLGETLQALTENEAWKSAAKEKPDFSALKNTQIALVVAGFETSESQVTDESSILNFKPRFALIADTHQWKWTAVSIAENQIGKFARKTYGDDVKLETSAKGDAKFFVWTHAGGKRKLFVAVWGGIIYAGNDESLLDRCLAVGRGEAENLTKNENLARARERSANDYQIAFGYVSPEGIAQIADFAGVSMAVEASEENAVRSFIARILPNILRKTTREIVWTARKTEQGIEDGVFVKTDSETASIFSETLAPAKENQFPAAEFMPLNFNSITHYNLENPQTAWRSVLLTAAKQLDAPSAKILLQAANLFFEPYGISDGESFLSATGAEIVTARFDEDGGKSVVIADVKDLEKLKKSISAEINFKTKSEKRGAADIWKSADGEIAAAFTEGKLILGDAESVLSCLQAKESGKNFAKTIQIQNFVKDSFVAATIAKDAETAPKIVDVLGNSKEDKEKMMSFYTTKTRFTASGFERRSVSDFGLTGSLLEKLGE